MKTLWSRFSLCLAVLLLGSALVPTAQGANTQELKTPVEAVNEMVWGVNLADLYIADMQPEEGSTQGYDDFAPSWREVDLGIAAWSVDGWFAWLSHWGNKSGTTDQSVSLPDYNAYEDDPYFLLGFMAKEPGYLIDVTLSNCKIIRPDGTEIPLPALNQRYTDRASLEPDINGWYPYFIPVEDFPGKDVDLTGAMLQITLTIHEDSYALTKAEYYFQFERTAMSQEILTDLFANEGVNVFRLPVTWTWFVNDQTFEIDQEWLDAVKTEVDYILSKGAYCILDLHNDYMMRSLVSDTKDDQGQWRNLHWTANWMEDAYKEYVDARFAAMWAQIAAYFQDYPQELIFETCNEPTMQWFDGRDYEHWVDTQHTRVNELNALFVDTVRSAGGENDHRFLCLAVAEYNQHQHLDALTLPEDDNLMVQLHSYNEMEGRADYDDATYDPNYDYVGETDLLFEDVERFQTAHPQVPVLIGEVGISHSTVIGEDEKAERVTYFFQKAAEHGVPCLWWEDYFPIYSNSNLDAMYWLYDKTAREWGRPQLLEAIQAGVGWTPPPVSDISVETVVDGDQLYVTAQLTTQQTGRSVCAVYDGDNRMVQVAVGDIENGQVRLELVCPAAEAAWIKVFFLDDALRPWMPAATYPATV